MKFKKINTITALAFGAVMALTACSKDDGAIPGRVSIEDVPAVSMNFESGASNVHSTTITFSTAPSFQGRFKASMFFEKETPPTKIDISVRKNSNLATITSPVTNTNVKTFKVDITTLPATFTVTAAELAALFGTAVAANDAYDFAPDIYINGKKYEAFPAASNGTGQGPAGMNTIGYGEYVRYYFK